VRESPWPCQRRFASIRTEAERALDIGFGQGESCRSVTGASEVKHVLSLGELAIRIEKRWVTCDSLIQQLGRLEQIRSRVTKKPRFQKSSGAAIQIKR